MRVPRAPRESEDGFSLIEVLVALVLMVLVASFTATGLITVAALDKNNRERSTAASLVEQKISNVRLAVASLSYGVTDSTVALNGTTFTLTTAIEPVSLGAGAGPCDGGAASGSTTTVDRVTVTATWPRMGGTKPVRGDTQVAPKTALGSTQYNIGVKVLNAANGPVFDHAVTLTPGSLASQTDTEGCAFFTGLASGNYTGTVNDLGWVDPSLKQSSSVTVGTPGVGQTAVGQLLYDSAATLSLTLPGTVVYPVPATMPVTLTSSGLKTGGPANVVACYSGKICGIFAGASSTTRTVSGLFPFSTGYQGWIGDCYGANAGPDTYAFTPGGTTVGLGKTGGAVDLKVTGSGVGAGQIVTLSQLAGSTGCPSSESYVVGTTSTVTGNVVHVWMPYGTWTVSMKNAANGTVTPGGTVVVSSASTVASPASVTVAVS